MAAGTVSILLSHDYRGPTSFIAQQMPDPAHASTGKKTKLAIAGFAKHIPEHHLRIIATEPSRLKHYDPSLERTHSPILPEALKNEHEYRQRLLMRFDLAAAWIAVISSTLALAIFRRRY